MSDVKHTPGPWVKGKFGQLYGASGRQVGVWDAGIARVSRDAEAEANARLIAAAPELLAACEEMIGTLWFKSPHGSDVINADAYKQMTDAIAKAKGQAQ